MCNTGARTGVMKTCLQNSRRPTMKSCWKSCYLELPASIPKFLSRSVQWKTRETKSSTKEHHAPVRFCPSIGTLHLHTHIRLELIFSPVYTAHSLPRACCSGLGRRGPWRRSPWPCTSRWRGRRGTLAPRSRTAYWIQLVARTTSGPANRTSRSCVGITQILTFITFWNSEKQIWVYICCEWKVFFFSILCWLLNQAINSGRRYYFCLCRLSRQHQAWIRQIKTLRTKVWITQFSRSRTRLTVNTKLRGPFARKLPNSQKKFVCF